MKTGTERRVTGRHVFAESEEFCIKWRSEDGKMIIQHSLTLLNPTPELVKAIRKAWGETEGNFLRWKTVEEIIEEELNK